ncbi:PEP-CTERM sorting domain-containing protein [Hydrocoleum sp. CS-953]
MYYTQEPNDVPEPASTLGLLVLGIIGLYSRLKTRRS